MLIVRPSASFRVVSMDDPALDAVPRDKMYEYGNTRKIELLELDTLPEQPTVFTCKPLQSQYEHLAEDSTPMQRWLVFSTHVEDIQGFPIPVPRTLQGTEDIIDPKAMNTLTPDVVEEIVGVITEWASKDGDTLPFTAPPTYWLTRRIQRRAIAASTVRTEETASDDSSK